MAVFRVEKSRDYTIMCNVHLRDMKLSLKAKGLLSLILSLPEDWNYSISGLAAICKESRDGINSALHELEQHGYLLRHRIRGPTGKFTDTEYIIYEKPVSPGALSPLTDFPNVVKPDAALPEADMPAQLNIEKQNTEVPKKDGARKTRAPCGLYQNVYLTEDELSKLKSDYSTDYEKRIDRLSEYMATTGKNYKNHYLTILCWARRDEEKAQASGKKRFEDYSCKEGESY